LTGVKLNSVIVDDATQIDSGCFLLSAPVSCWLPPAVLPTCGYVSVSSSRAACALPG
jgi:hypothetical protein